MGGEGKERGRGRRERKRPVGAVRAFGTRNPRRKGRNVLSTLHVGAQTNRGTRSLFLSGGCGGGGTKSLRLPPPPSLASLSISVYLSFSPTAFFPHFPLRLSHRQSLPLSRPPPPPPPSLPPSSFSLPFRHGGPTRSFFSSRYASFYATAQPWSPSLSRVRISPSLFFLLSLHHSSSCSRTQPPPSLFRRYCLPPLFLFHVQTDRAREQASGKIRTVRRTRK